MQPDARAAGRKQVDVQGQGGREETRFCSFVLDRVPDSKFSYLKPPLHCHLTCSTEVNYFFSKLMQSVLKTIGVMHEKVFGCLTPNPTSHIQF